MAFDLYFISYNRRIAVTFITKYLTVRGDLCYPVFCPPCFDLVEIGVKNVTGGENLIDTGKVIDRLGRESNFIQAISRLIEMRRTNTQE